MRYAPRELGVYVVPPNAWDAMLSVLREVVAQAIPDPSRAIAEPDPLVSAILGKFVSSISNMERSLVTRLGRNAAKIVAPFFDHCEEMKGYWHMRCIRLREDGDARVFTVKTVLGPRAFNSSEKRRVREESTIVPRPVILTIAGSFKGRHSELVGRAYWLDAWATWEWLSLDPRGYRRFLDTLYEEFKPLREKIFTAFMEEWRRRKEAIQFKNSRRQNMLRG